MHKKYGYKFFNCCNVGVSTIIIAIETKNAEKHCNSEVVYFLNFL